MKGFTLIIAAFLIVAPLAAQRIVEESIPVKEQTELNLEFPYASSIDLEYWDKNEVMVKVSVQINDGNDNEIYKLLSRSSSDVINVYTDKDFFKNADRKKNCWQSDIYYTVTLPKSMLVNVETISGDINSEFQGKEFNFKTISGDIELKVIAETGAQLDAKTISGEIYSNVDIEYLDGKKGLKQIVGMKVKGNLFNGGVPLNLETISGDIFLRKI